MIVHKIEDPVLMSHLENIGRDGADIFLLAQGTIRVVTVQGTFMANQMRMNHGLEGPSVGLLAKAYLAALAAAAALKNMDRLGLVLESDGPVRGFAVDANAQGHVRGYLTNGQLPEEEPEEKLIGDGTLAMIRYPHRARHPVQGQIADLTGDLAVDMERYYERSEQTPTKLKLAVERDFDNRVLGAVAIQVQRLPGADEEDWEMISRLADGVEAPARKISQGLTTARLVHNIFGPWNPKLIASRQAEFYCSCSKERFGRFLSALPGEEQDDILANGPFPLTTVCHNCNSSYVFSRDEARSLFEQHPYESPASEEHTSDDDASAG
jgi:molecular chaperone Hsp33